MTKSQQLAAFQEATKSLASQLAASQLQVQELETDNQRLLDHNMQLALERALLLAEVNKLKNSSSQPPALPTFDELVNKVNRLEKSLNRERTEAWNQALEVAASLVIDDGNPAIARQRILSKRKTRKTPSGERGE